MPQTRDIALEQLTAAGSALPISGTRVDAAHSLGDALVSGPPLADLPVAEAIVEIIHVEGAVQLQSQADQLAAHLRQRQQEIDRREAQLNARLADFEKEVREARVWLAERNEALNEREARLEDSGSEGSGITDQGSGFRAAKSSRAGIQVSDDAGSNDQRSVGNGVPSGPRGVPPPTAAQTETAPPACNPAAEAQNQLEGRSGKVAAAWRMDDLDRREAELEKFREKVSQMHREALQLRLAAEEAQAELRAALGVERADEAVALGHRRLARYFQDETAKLTRLRNELEWLRSEQSSGQPA
jgi:hypothetical protein